MSMFYVTFQGAVLVEGDDIADAEGYVRDLLAEVPAAEPIEINVNEVQP